MKALAYARVTWPGRERVTPLGLVEAETEEELDEKAARLQDATGAPGVLVLDHIEQAPVVYLIRDLRNADRAVAAFQGCDEEEAHREAERWLVEHPRICGMYEVWR